MSLTLSGLPFLLPAKNRIRLNALQDSFWPKILLIFLYSFLQPPLYLLRVGELRNFQGHSLHIPAPLLLAMQVLPPECLPHSFC